MHIVLYYCRGKIQVWQLHHPPESKSVSLKSVIEAATAHITRGTIGTLGMCNSSVEDLAIAASITPLAVVQVLYALCTQEE